MEPPEVREEIRIDGRPVTLRTLRPADRDLESAFVRGLSPRSRRYRFHSGLRELTPELLHRFTHMDYPAEMALCATVLEDGREHPIGVARWARAAHDPQGAEVAIAVADAWQGKRLGATLLGRLRNLAAAAGIRRLYASVLAENRRMLELARFLGYRVAPGSRERGSVTLGKETDGASGGEEPRRRTRGRMRSMDRVEVRGAGLATGQTGHGATDLVLVHGFQNDRSAWDPFVERLDPSRFRTTRFDLVGCGQSSAPDAWRRCTIDEYARDLAALCDAEDLAAPVLVGHSLGGATALRAVLDAPERFAGLVLVAPASTSGLDFLPEDAFEGLAHPTPDQQRELARAAFRRPPPPAYLESLFAVIARATPEHIEGAARSMRDFRCQEALGGVSTPTLLVCGDRDRHVPLRNHLATWRAIPRCGLQVYHDVGHVPFVEVADDFARDVLRFVEARVAPREA